MVVLQRVEEVDVDMEQVQVQEIKIQVADEPVQFQYQTMEEVDVDILITSVTPAQKPTVFHPFSPFQWKAIAAKFSLGFQEHTVADDGNCFFRSISNLLLGTEEKHDAVCSKTVEYIMEPANWDKLKTYIQEYICGLDYINNTQMVMVWIWATEVEIFACAHICSKDIIIYTLDRWQRYPASGTSKRLTKNGFYLNNK